MSEDDWPELPTNPWIRALIVKHKHTDWFVLKPADMSKWITIDPPKREWTVPNVIPKRQVALLTGDGGTGKSILDLQRKVAHVLGKLWLGLEVAQGPVMVVNAEDEEAEFHRRLNPILRHHKATFADLIKGGFHLYPLSDMDATLATYMNNQMTPTPLFRQLEQEALKHKPISITLDASADVFGGNENDRTQVRQFIRLLRGLAIDSNSDATLLAHPSISGLESERGHSGSTAWHNSVRSRFYLKFTADRDVREFIMKKQQYGNIPERMLLRWTDGLFLPEVNVEPSSNVIDEMFIMMLRRFNQTGTNVSPKPGPNDAPTQFSKQPDANGITKQAFKLAMDRLLIAKKIRIETYSRFEYKRLIANP